MSGRSKTGLCLAAVLALLLTACQFDPAATNGEPGFATCDGIEGTLGFGYYAAQDPVTGSSYVGTEGDDVIVITNGPVTVDALGGDDLICVTNAVATAPGAEITIIGGDGDDEIVGSAVTYEVCDAEVATGCDADTNPPDCSVGSFDPSGLGTYWWTVSITPTDTYFIFYDGVFHSTRSEPFDQFGDIYAVGSIDFVSTRLIEVARSMDGVRTTCGLVPGPITCSIGDWDPNGTGETYWTVLADTPEWLNLRINGAVAQFGTGPIAGIEPVHFTGPADNTEDLVMEVSYRFMPGSPVYACGTWPAPS